jgi:hypothetical protein
VTWQWTWPSVGEGGWPSGFQLLSWLCLLRLRSCKYFLLTAHAVCSAAPPGCLAGCRLLLAAACCCLLGLRPVGALWRTRFLDLAGWLGPGRCWLRLPGRGVHSLPPEPNRQ